MLPGLVLRLKYKLPIFFLLISVIPLFIVNYVWFQASKKQVIAISSAQLVAVSDRAKSEVNSFLTKKLTSLIVHSQTIAVKRVEILPIQEELVNFLTQDEDIKQIRLLNNVGQEIVHLSKEKTYLKDELINLSQSPAFKVTTFVGGDRYIGPIYLDESGTQVIDIAIPIVNTGGQSLTNLSTSSKGLARTGGEVSGVLVGTISLNNLWVSLNLLKIGENGKIFLLDTRGFLINHPDEKFNLQKGLNLSQLFEYKKFVMENDQNDNSIVNNSVNEYDEQALTFHSKPDYTDWVIMGEIPLSDVLSETNRVLAFAAILQFLFIVSVTFLSLWLSGTLIDRIELLREGSIFISQGNLEHKIEIKSGDELEELANSYNTMAQSLKEAFKRVQER